MFDYRFHRSIQWLYHSTRVHAVINEEIYYCKVLSKVAPGMIQLYDSSSSTSGIEDAVAGRRCNKGIMALYVPLAPIPTCKKTGLQRQHSSRATDSSSISPIENFTIACAIIRQ